MSSLVLSIDESAGALRRALSDATPGSSSRLDTLWDVSKAVSTATPESLRSVVQELHSVLLTAIPLCSAPTLRRLATSTMCALYDQGRYVDRDMPLKAVKSLVSGFAKTPKDSRAGVLGAIAEIVRLRGFEVSALQADLISLAKKQLKEGPALCEAALSAFASFLEGWPQSVPALAPSLVKSLKNRAADKSPEVRARAAMLLAAVNRTFADFATQEQRLAICTKLLEDPNESVRQEASNAFAVLLGKGLQKPPATPSKERSSASSPAGAQGGDGEERRHVPKNSMTPILEGAFGLLEPLFLRPGCKREFRPAVADVYVKVLKTLTGADIDANMELIVGSLIRLLRNPRAALTAQEAAQARVCTSAVLRYFGGALREIQQQRMAKLLSKALKDRDSGELALVAALRELCLLIAEIGEAGPDMHEWLAPLVTALLPHQSGSVRLAAATCLRALGHALPSQLAALMRGCLSEIATHSGAISACAAANFTELPKHVFALRGFGVALAALVAVIDHAPLGVPNTLSKLALAAAESLLSQPAHGDFKANEARADVAWSVIAALLGARRTAPMATAALPQLISHWLAALSAGTGPQPRTAADVAMFLPGKASAVRALEALCARKPGGLLVDRVLPVLLPPLRSLLDTVHSLCVAAMAPTAAGSAVPPGAQAGDLTSLSPALQDGLVMLAGTILSVFARMPPSTGVLSTCFGPLHRLALLHVTEGPQATLLHSLLSPEDDILGPWAEGDAEQAEGAAAADSAIAPSDSPVVDYSVAWNADFDVALGERPAPAAETVDKAVRILALLFATQSEESQMHILTPLGSGAVAGRLNTLTTLVAVVREMNEKRVVVSPQGVVIRTLVDILRKFLVSADGDARMTRGAGESLGLICRLAGDAYTSAMVGLLGKLSAQAPAGPAGERVRAGCAMALGCVQRYVGGIRAAAHLTSTVKLLREMAGDQLPGLQVAALHAHCLVIDAAGPSYQVEQALAMLRGLLQSPSHATATTLRAIGAVANAVVGAVGPELKRDGTTMRTCSVINEELRLHPHPLVQLESARFYQRLIMFAPQAVTAPEITPLLEVQLSSPWLTVRQAAVTCLRMLVQGKWHSQLGVDPLRIAAHLFAMLDSESDRRLLAEGELVLSTLAERLSPSAPARWLSLLSQIVLTTHSTSKSGKPPAGVPAPESDSSSSSSPAAAPHRPSPLPPPARGGRGRGDEGEGDGDGDGDGEGDDGEGDDAPRAADEEEEEEASKPQTVMSAEEVNDLSGPQNELVPRWRTKVFAMDCVHRLLETVRSLPNSDAHFDMFLAGPSPAALAPPATASASASAAKDTTKDAAYLIHSIQDLVKLVFFAATSAIDPLRPAGVRLMRDMVSFFGKAADPHAEGHLFLELFEVQFASALTRAFNADAPPLATEAACDVLVAVIRGGICAPTSVPRLVSLLGDRISTLRELSFPQYSERAATIVQVAVLSALAKLHALAPSLPHAEARQAVADRLNRSQASLRSLWMDFVRDFAVLTALAQAVRESYHAAFFVPPEADEVAPSFAAAWPSVLGATCAVVGADPGAQLPDVAILLGMAARELTSLRGVEQSSTPAAHFVDCLRLLLVRPEHFVPPTRGPSHPPVLTPATVEELVAIVSRSVDVFCPPGSPASHPVLRSSAARFAAQLAESLPADFFADTARLPVLEQLARLSVSQMVSMTAAAQGTTANSDQVASTLAAISALSRFLSSGDVRKAFTPGLMLVALRCAAAVPAMATDAVRTIAALAKKISADGDDDDDAWISELLEKGIDSTISLAQDVTAAGARPFSTPATHGLVVVLSALVILLVNHKKTKRRQQQPQQQQPFVASHAVTALGDAMGSAHGPSRMSAIETLRTVVQLATTEPTALLPTATLFLRELGPAVSGTIARASRAVGAEAGQKADFDADDVAELTAAVRIMVLAHTLAPADRKLASLSAVVPPLSSLLRPSARPGTNSSALHGIAFQVVMHFATSSASDFRAFISGIEDPSERSSLELSIRQSAEAASRAAVATTQQGTTTASSSKPEMKMDFSKYS